jgi:hypothetical protein
MWKGYWLFLALAIRRTQRRMPPRNQWQTNLNFAAKKDHKTTLFATIAKMRYPHCGFQ